ncbi:MAG: DUF3857 domain-containing protein [Pyrinomonadaceae bacterium]|nr:DUF3857 domain-containing protein [Pyrinomonadaceae bacterium]
MRSKFPIVSILVFAIVSAAFSTTHAQGKSPQWLKQAIAKPVPSYEKDVPAVVLHDEQQVTYGADGKLVSVENFAVRLLSREGRDYAVARAFYLVSSGKVREINAWLIRSDGTVKEYGKSAVVDRIADPDDVYNEGRIKIIDARDDADSGAVFGYTVVSEDSPLFYQDTWLFQDRLPTLLSKYSLTLPEGWKATSLTFNAPEIVPQVTGTTWAWEIRDLKPIPPEPLSPSIVNLAPRITISYAPESGNQGVNRAFADWLDVSRWATALYEPEVVIDENIKTRARDLTVNAKTELEKIQAIGNFVQNLQYISIDIGVGHGNGYRPRPSNVVLSRGYGDCKDKANLMRALLKTLNIDAFPIAIYSGDPSYVRGEWPSPQQFNHCIIAVKVSSETHAATIMEHPKLGRLLIFDATDPYTPVGDLPDYLQGSNALIIAGENGGLAKMPVTPTDFDVLERKIDVTISPVGEISGKISETAKGQLSTSFRSEHRGMSSEDYRKAIEGWLTRGATGAQLDNMSYKDRESEAAFDLEVKFSASRYGQLMQNRLLVFKPVIVGRRNSVALTEQKRVNPVELDSSLLRETIIFNLPEGFAVDEVPNSVNLDTPFGKYSTSYEHVGDTLVFKRSVKFNRTVISPEKYHTVREFFSKMLDAEQSPVVLIRK